MIARRAWIERDGELAVSRQCDLAGVGRSWVYGAGVGETLDELDLRLLELIDAQYTRRPFYGSRRMVAYLKEEGHAVNRKRVQRLMRVLGLAGMAPGPATSRPHPEHKIYPYLLRGVAVVRPNQVWSSDITYIRLAHGFAYLVAVIDWYARRVLAWRISNTLEAGFCVDCLEDALRAHGRPEVFNTDQGSQFTSEAFTGVLLRAGIAISMDGRGRALDNIFVERLWRSLKYEDVYLNGYTSMPELLLGLTEYFAFYNGERPHQALGNRTPDAVYRSGEGGGASIVDRFGGPPGPSPAPPGTAGEGLDPALAA
jgi:putative transposase